jgi:hypothetical protein
MRARRGPAAPHEWAAPRNSRAPGLIHCFQVASGGKNSRGGTMFCSAATTVLKMGVMRGEKVPVPTSAQQLNTQFKKLTV